MVNAHQAAGQVSPDNAGDYVQLLVGCQSRLYAFILSLVCDPDQAGEVLQEVNVVLWEKSDQFELGTNFTAWAMRIAHFQVMAHRQRRGRDRHVFDQETISLVADAFERHAGEAFEQRMTALSHCLNELPAEDRQLIHHRYGEGDSVKDMAQRLGHSANRLAVRLHRLRAALMKCVRKRQMEAGTA